MPFFIQGMMLMKSYSKYILLILSLNIMLTACSETEVTEHIEVFVSESLEANEEGMFERKGYEKINSITTTERSENHINTTIKAIKDYYDAEGRYLHTEIIHSYFEKSTVTQFEDGNEQKKTTTTPLTIFIPQENFEQFSKTLSADEKKKVKKHVSSFVDDL